MRIKEAINMVFWKYKDLSQFKLVIYDRFTITSEIPFEEIERVDNNYIYLKDGETVIPIHRVLEIKKGNYSIWKRKNG
ncbi:DUF504 domain-containing protein [Acidianus brierleyi]|uniref:UPF0248 protein DFR85_04460 n=1 Tax=Acidianus brierleyi TaxID=41673 RepID=A0A2U9IDG3_9CREN|nr:RNA repair domain-containing protein [Acidianus brierleyi]AWR93984.1 DUF504 domain-containing protein [Acidianus brierleyi]